VAEPELSFAGLLRQLRAEAMLTQEELAEAAGLSPRSVSDLERGISRTAHKDTALLLAGALELEGPRRELFVAAARGKAPAAEVLRQHVPPVPSAAGHNLPAPLTSLVGRDQELGDVSRLAGEARLVTLTGTGGVGKTRLALEAAAGLVGRFADGVWLAELAGVTSAALVAPVVMEALGVRQEADVPVLEALRYRLRSADLLLVLDNCEHLLDACAHLAGMLLRSSPGLRVLATSREQLGVAGEVAYPVRPLPVVPDRPDATAGACSPAVRLFLDRGSAARGGAAVLEPVMVAERICRTLDGLPLAIELAAARMGTLSAEEIEAHLTDRFRFLAYRRPAADPRHQALQAAMDWSYALLSAQDRKVFGELSVFAGSFGLAELAGVCGDGDESASLEVISRLAGKSLVAPERSGQGTRYRLLETVRQYAADRLAEAGTTAAVKRRHALAYLGLAERERRLEVLSRDHDNFRAALEWSLNSEDETGPRLAHALGEFWLARGLLYEARERLERALAQTVPDQRMRAGLLRLLGAVLYDAGDLDRAEATLSQGAEVAAAAGAVAAQARIRVLLADVHGAQGTGFQAALAECQAATAILESENDLEGLAEAWLLTGKLRIWLVQPPADQDALEQALAYARQSGSHRAQILAACWLVGSLTWLPIPADVAITQAEQLLQAASGDPWAETLILSPSVLLYGYAGRYADARAASVQSRSTLARAGARYQWAVCAVITGQMELTTGNPAAAERQLKEVHEPLRDMKDRGWVGYAAALMADALYAQGHLGEAQQMTEEAEAETVPDDHVPRAWWRMVRAKLLARRGDFSAARLLLGQAEALIPPIWGALQAEALMARAEVDRLAGAHDQAAASLHSAVLISENRRAAALADRAKAALTSLTKTARQPDTKTAGPPAKPPA
jgi:non-specific serine/threonine protein kinase